MGVGYGRAFTTPEVQVEIGGGQDRLSVDGEIRVAEALTLGVREQTLWLPVGEESQPRPDADEEGQEMARAEAGAGTHERVLGRPRVIRRGFH